MASYQPIFDLATDWVAGVQVVDLKPHQTRDALRRLALLPPTTFIVVDESADPTLDGLLREIPPSRLVVRVGERAFDRPGPLPRPLRRFRARGGRLALDAALVSTRQIVRLAPCLLYLDPRDTHRIDDQPATRVGAIAVVAQALQAGALVAAPDIRGRRELAALRGIGVSYGQGPLLADALPVDSLVGIPAA